MEIIAELGINHNGDLKLAKQMIDVAASAGCQYVKFQKRDIDLVYSKEELRKPRMSPWGETTREQKEGLEFTRYEYDEIDMYCLEKGIGWFASPWDANSLEILIRDYGPPFIKIPSARMSNEEFLEDCASYVEFTDNIKFILSTGMCNEQMIDDAIHILGMDNIYCIMQCTSTYPTAPNEINAIYITKLKEKYPWAKIGFSNHYPGLMAMVLAAAYGAEMIEFHLTMDRTLWGSDQSSSIEPKGLFELMERLRLIEQMKGDGIKRICKSEIPIMEKLR